MSDADWAGPELTQVRDALDKASLHGLIRAVHDFRKTATGFQHSAAVHILRNHTVDNLKWFLAGQGLLEQMSLSVTLGDYDTMMQEIIDPHSALYQNKAEAVIISLLLENFVPDFNLNRFSVETIIERLGELVEALETRSSALIVLNTFLLPVSYSEGFLSLKKSDSIENKIVSVNSWMQELCRRDKRVYLVDCNRIEQRLGTIQSRDHRLWYVAKALLTNKFLKEYAFEVVKIIKALKGKNKKCLVLDCDNTLWGGIIGEDGIDRIQLNPHDYPGNIFYRFQQNVLQLVKRGVVVALCSKNNEDDVWEVLENHPHCILKRSNLSAWRIDWGNKADNIRSLAEELNLGLDSLVFVDDDPTACALVTSMCPEVKVLKVPEDLPTYPEVLLRDGLFDALAISQEDGQRTTMYQAEANRKVQQRQYTSYDEFLASLQLVAKIFSVEGPQVSRVAQLTQKTNQFNLTTRRYSEADIEAFIQSPDYDVLYLQLSDCFGDYGIVGVCIVRYEKDAGIFDTFLFSCRALGRGAEDVFLSHCLKIIQQKGKRLATGQYFPTPKNGMVKDFYEKRGFRAVAEDEKKRTLVCDLNSFEFKTLPFYKDIIV